MATAARTPHPPNRRAITPPVIATSNDGDLPLDLLYEILLRLPAQMICRFRTVCRSWQSVLSHSEFIIAAHYPGPLLAVGVKDTKINEVHVLDMESGDAVKHVNIAANKAFLSQYDEAPVMSYDRVVCLGGMNKPLRLLDLASGALSILPNHLPSHGYNSTEAIVGRAASTGEHKVLAISISYVNAYEELQVCKILTLGLGNGGWRDMGSPPLPVMSHSKSFTVINDVAYFLSSYRQSMVSAHQITVFDFSREAWRPKASCLRGPIDRRGLSLAELDGCLVASHANSHTSIELWFLVDLDRSQWSKLYTFNLPCKEYFEKQLGVLRDGRIVMLTRVVEQGFRSRLRIYNRRTKTFSDGTKVPNCSHFSVFTWSLLHLGQQGPLDMAAKRLLLDRQHHQSGSTHSTTEGHNKKRRTSDLI